MEEGLGSSGGLVKKKNSSGCLIIKKKKDENSSSVKVFDDKKKKRPRLVLTDSESSDDSLEQSSKKVVETSGLSNSENESERKRRLDVFEFNEYNSIDEKRLKRERDFERGSSKDVTVEKRKQFDKMGKKELAGSNVKSKLKTEENDVVYEKRTKKERDFQPGYSKQAAIEKRKQFALVKTELVDYSVKRRLKIEGDDDGDLPISSLREKLHSPPKETIRSQGKNGVLKVTVSKKKTTEVSNKSKERKLDIQDKKFSKSEEITKKNKSVSFSSESKVMRKKREVKVGKPTITEACSPSRVIKERDQSPGKITPVKGSICKIKRGSGTEKQKLREKLKNILLDAGWKIDYRPRRSRDYLDAVYISPRGTAYWSIVKAYDAFQKHMDDDVEMEPSSFSEDIKILTRKTQRAIEREMKTKRKRNNIKGRSTEESDEESDSDEDGKSMKRNDSLKKNAKKISKESDDRKDRKLGRGTLLVRCSNKGLNSEDEGYIAYTGKRTLLSWLIDSGIVSSSEEVKYMNRRQTRVLLKGWITRGGIHCSCCSKIVSVSKFEIHAGNKVHQPYQNIYLESGVSLLQCQVEAWNKQAGSDHSGFHSVDIDGEDQNDDTCSLCGDGGDLICCDSCPSTFHQSCLGIEMLQPGDWHCPNCTCKFCGIGGADSSADENDKAVNVMLACGLCENKYHESCCEKVDDSSNSIRSSAFFCGSQCHKIFDHLKKILGVKHKLDVGFSWSLIHRSNVDIDASHRAYPQRVISNSKLAVALSVMDECFLPIIDRRSEINLVNSILYNCGSNFSRLNFSGFYTVILERGDEIVAAASIRFRGTKLAEMPFIGTRHMYRRQGMCHRLLGAIESVLCSLKVKKLTIPAIAEHMHTWTAIFGFKPCKVSHKQELKPMNMVVFPDVDMLQKFIVKKKTSEADITANSALGGESISPEDNHHLTPGMKKKDDVDACAGHNIDTGDGGATLHNGDEANDKSDAVEPCMVVPLNGNNTKEMINEGEDPVYPLSPSRSDQLDVEPTCTSNQLGIVSPISLNRFEGLDVGPTTNSAQLDMNGFVKKDSEVDEAVKVCDSVVDADSKADPANNCDVTVFKIASIKPVVNNIEAEDNVNHGDLSTQNGTFGDKECVQPLKSDSAQLEMNGLVKKDSEVDEADKVCDSVVVTDAEADPNNSCETVIEIASDKPVVYTIEAEDNVNHGNLPTQNGTRGDKKCVELVKSDSAQLDINGLVKKDSEADEAVKVCDSVVGADSKSDQANNSDETVPEIASDKPVVNTIEVEDNVNHGDLPTQIGTLGVKECVPVKSDSAQLEMNGLVKKDSKADETDKVCDSVVDTDAEADPANNSDKTVPEIASDKPVVNTTEAEDNVNHGDLPTQNGTLGDKECVQPVKFDAPPSEDGDVDDGHKHNGEVASIEPGLDCFTETPSRNKGVSVDEDPLSVVKLKKETISKMTSDSENGMAKEVYEVIAVGPDLNFFSTEDTVEEVKENNKV